MLNLKLTIRANALAQAAPLVFTSKQHDFDVTLEYAPARKKIFGYIETAEAANMIGFVQSLSDNNNNPLTVDSCVDILTLGYTAKVTGCDESKKEIYVLVIPDAKPIAKNGQNINCSAEIQKIIADIIAAGILTEAECKERLSYMKDVAYVRIPFADSLIVAVFKDILSSGKRPDNSVRAPRCLYKDNYNFVEDYKNKSIVADCVNKAILKHHTIYQGDKSVGKTVMVETVCWLLNKPIQRAQANERMTSEHLFGSKTTAASEIMKFSEAESIRLSLLSLRADKGDVLTDENYADVAKWKAAIARSQAPMIVEEDGPLKLALKNGEVFNLEETNLLNPNTMGVLNNCNDGSSFVQTASGVIEINPGYVFMGTQNTGSSYVGINKQNAASMSRIDFIKFPYNKDIKNILIEAVKDETKDVLTDAYFTAANKFYIAVSTEYKNGAVSDASMNIRGIIRALDEVASVNVGGTIFKPMTTLKQALKTCVIDVDEENADNQNLLRILDSISL